MNIDAVIQAERARMTDMIILDDGQFLKDVRRQIAQNGYFTAGPREDGAVDPVVVLHPLPKADQEIMFHNHSCFELAFVYRGSCRNKFKDYEISMSRGDLLLLNPRAVHCLVTDSPEDVVFNFLCPVKLFDSTFFRLLPENSVLDFIMDYFYQTGAQEDFIVVNAGENGELLALLEKLILEDSSKQTGYETMLRTGLAQVFVYMARIYGEKLRALPMQHSSAIIRRLILYITRNLSTVTLANAAKALNYNDKYISRLMKQELGMSFSQYVQMQRLQNAVDLLVKINMRIEDIIRKVGYTNLSHFYRIFQHQYNTTPSVYRRDFAVNAGLPIAKLPSA